MSWQSVEQRYADLLSSSIYPNLIGDRYYRQFLTNAGIGNKLPPSVTVLAPDVQKRLRHQAEVHARITVRQLGSLSAVDANSVKAEALGKTKLYRGISIKNSSTVGIWWFTQDLLDKSKRAAGTGQKARLEWLRELLAVCLDWSDFDSLQVLSIHANESVPAITGRGLPQPKFSKDGWQKVTPQTYFAKYGEVFRGGVTQVILPFVPAHVHPLMSF